MKEILEIEGQKIVDYIKSRLIGAGKVASGSLVNSIDYQVLEDGKGGWELQILANDYLDFVDEGRRPGTFPPIDNIKEWIIDKRLPLNSKSKNEFTALNQTAFVIARGIKENGIKPLNFMDGVQSYIDELIVNITKQQVEELKEDILSKLKKLGNK